jgi:hypothetical protein
MKLIANQAMAMRVARPSCRDKETTVDSISSATIATADYKMRHWDFDVPGPIKFGDPSHYAMLTRLLLETYNPYKPAVLDWPKLDPETLQRITSLPIWDIAVQTEIKASERITAFSKTVRNPELRAALVHMAAEEARHRDVLSRLVAAYDIPILPDGDYPLPNDAEWGFLVTGYSECIDSFFAYGLFEMANRSGFFPPELAQSHHAALAPPLFCFENRRCLGIFDLGADWNSAVSGRSGRRRRQLHHEWLEGADRRDGSGGFDRYLLGTG